MTAIVNNARYSRNRGGNFQRSFLLFLAWHISHCLSVSDNYCPPTWKGTLNFPFFFFFCSFESNVAAEAEWGLGLKPPKWAEVVLFFLLFFFLEKEKAVWEKRGQESKWEWHLPSAEACFVPAIHAPGGEICIANWQSAGLFHKWTGGSGHGSHTQPIRHSAPDKRPTPPPRSRLTGPKALNSSLGGGQPNVVPGWLPRAGAHSGGFVPAARPGEGPGPGPGQGEETNSSDKLQAKVNSVERQLPGRFVCLFVLGHLMRFCVERRSFYGWRSSGPWTCFKVGEQTGRTGFHVKSQPAMQKLAEIRPIVATMSTSLNYFLLYFLLWSNFPRGQGGSHRWFHLRRLIRTLPNADGGRRLWSWLTGPFRGSFTF